MSVAIPDHFRVAFRPVAAPAAVITGPNVRFTILTDRLLRLEYSSTNTFEDRPSQAFWYREQPVPLFTTEQTSKAISIDTTAMRLTYAITLAGFTQDTLQIEVKSSGTIWRFGDPNPRNLGGTLRTLDDISGSAPLEPGLLSEDGWAVIDDSASLVFNAESWLEPRNTAPETQDLYFFGYGRAYQDCLRDYTLLTGGTPLIPRWALGNWWSRYWAYDEAALVTLIEDFKTHGIPLSVCIIDMDWHITQTGNTSTGWTGYTWNRELFPDPDRLQRYLHAQGLRTSMNLHPAEGIHPHEERYPQMARRLGIDPASRLPIPFDIADPEFTNAYFEELHHPEEARGVDFWWTDWQQGTLSKLPGLDPLWWLNHLHFLDLGRAGKRPFIFSRWGGYGNHRYPIGFSGDTYIGWESLAFQPYFTASAANVRYGWWSHDIGGHHLGIEDPELYLRWVQFGVLSPIMRLHCTKNEFHDRRPWVYDAETLRLTRQALRFRHALIPYLYTMAWRDHTENLALIRPMYHTYPDQEAAYHCPQQYLFGSDLIAAPFTAPADAETRLSRTIVWLPEGDWYEFSTGERFTGNGWQAIYGTWEAMPLFARAGAIIPLGPDVDWGGVENPAELHLHVFAGADGSFTLYEDDGDSTAYQAGAHALTTFSQRWQTDRLEVTIAPVEGNAALVPATRRYHLHVHGVGEPDDLRLASGDPARITATYDSPTETLHFAPIAVDAVAGAEIAVTRSAGLLYNRDRTLEKCHRMIGHFALNTTAQQQLVNRLTQVLADPATQFTDFAAHLRPQQARALLETAFQFGFEHQRGIDCAERLILWNNHGIDAASYQYAYAISNSLQSEQGPLPRFRAFVPERDIRPVGRHRKYAWRLRLNYFDQFNADLSGQS